jgi:hypothetical protein
VAELKEAPGVDVDYIRERNREEPWREVAFLMRAKLVVASEHPTSAAGYRHPEELLADVELLAESLREVGSEALVEQWIVPLKRQIHAFGFHSAVLDVRQNSAFHEKAMAQLLAMAGIAGRGIEIAEAVLGTWAIGWAGGRHGVGLLSSVGGASGSVWLRGVGFVDCVDDTQCGGFADGVCAGA